MVNRRARRFHTSSGRGVWITLAVSSALICGTCFSQSSALTNRHANTIPSAWVQSGFKDFVQGEFDDGGSNLYVSAKGEISMINNFDVNNDGYPDIVLANAHDYIERGPTWIYQPDDGPGTNWQRRQLPNDSGWMSRIVDVDGDGYPD